jgi:hypothetical protein
MKNDIICKKITIPNTLLILNFLFCIIYSLFSDEITLIKNQQTIKYSYFLISLL